MCVGIVWRRSTCTNDGRWPSNKGRQLRDEPSYRSLSVRSSASDRWAAITITIGHTEFRPSLLSVTACCRWVSMLVERAGTNRRRQKRGNAIQTTDRMAGRGYRKEERKEGSKRKGGQKRQRTLKPTRRKRLRAGAGAYQRWQRKVLPNLICKENSKQTVNKKKTKSRN